MKNQILSLAFIIVSMVAIKTEAQSYKKGDKLVNAGIGLRAYWIPIGGTIEYGITDAISVGPSIYVAKWGSYGGTVLYLGGRGSYHFNELLNLEGNKLDVYGGAGLGYQNWSYKGSAGSYSSRVYIPIHVGGRYYFNEKMGVHAELGSGVASLLGGITLKL